MRRSLFATFAAATLLVAGVATASEFTPAIIFDMGGKFDKSFNEAAYGGAERDVLIANVSGDRLVDWVGDFNRYVLPHTSFGAPTISRNLKPKLFEFLYDLSKADGADQTLGYSGDPRNGEPNGELGLVAKKDPDWENQMETPDDDKD